MGIYGQRCVLVLSQSIFSITPMFAVEMGIATGEVAGTLPSDICTLSMAPLPYLASNKVS